MDVSIALAYHGLWLDDRVVETRYWVPVLERAGLKVDVIGTSRAAELSLEANPRRYAFVLLDLDLPETDGFEAFRRIRRIDDAIPIIVVSGHIGEPEWDARLGLLPGVIYYKKPMPSEYDPAFPSLVGTISSMAAMYLEGVGNARPRAGVDQPSPTADPGRHLKAVVSRAEGPRTVKDYLSQRSAEDLKAMLTPGSTLIDRYYDTAIRLLKKARTLGDGNERI
ncbi:MAG: response regulator [Gemmatimonadales bacterium]